MDMAALIYSFVLAMGGHAFVVNDFVEVSPQVVEVDVQTMGLGEDKRYILLVDNGKVTQHVRVPLVSAECEKAH